MRDTAQLHQLITLRRAAAVLPESARASFHDVVAVGILDAPRVTMVLAWPPHSHSRAVADLVRAAAG